MRNYRKHCWTTQRLAKAWMANHPQTGINGINSVLGIQGLWLRCGIWIYWGNPATWKEMQQHLPKTEKGEKMYAFFILSVPPTD